MKIVNVHLPDNKAIFVALQRIYGISKTTALEICSKLNFNPSQKIKELKREDEDIFNSYIEENYVVEDRLKKQIEINVARKVSIRTYAGTRISKGLPLKQRTKSNAKSSRKVWNSFKLKKTAA